MALNQHFRRHFVLVCVRNSAISRGGLSPGENDPGPLVVAWSTGIRTAQTLYRSRKSARRETHGARKSPYPGRSTLAQGVAGQLEPLAFRMHTSGPPKNRARPGTVIQAPAVRVRPS